MAFKAGTKDLPNRFARNWSRSTSEGATRLIETYRVEVVPAKAALVAR